MPYIGGGPVLEPSINIFIIGSSNAKRVFSENYAGNFLKIGNPETALSQKGDHDIR